MSEALTTLREEFAALATEQAKAESGAQEFYKISSGVLMYNGSPVPNNELAVVIVDAIHENVYYDRPYDANSPGAPTCFAFGRNDEEMAPHEVCVNAGTAQAPKCKGCKHNEFGTARLGKGKACRNTRRLATIAAGKWENGKYVPVLDPDYYANATPVYLRLPVTSVKAFKAYVSKTTTIDGCHTAGVMTRIKVTPDPKNQFAVNFDKVGLIGDELLPVMFKRVQEIRATIDFPYSPGMEEPEAEVPTGKAKKVKY